MELSDEPEERRDGLFSLSSSITSAFIELRFAVLIGLLLILIPLEGMGEARTAPGHLTTQKRTNINNAWNINTSKRLKEDFYAIKVVNLIQLPSVSLSFLAFLFLCFCLHFRGIIAN